jgi:UrcA family protein
MQSTAQRAILAVTLASICAIARAGGPVEPAQRTVRFADLDLTRPAGVTVLRQRIRAAAEEVCQPLSEHDLGMLAASRACVTDAIARAVKDVNSPMLSRSYQGKTELVVLADR